MTILWKDNKLKLQNNYSNAGKRLGGKEKRLSKDEELVKVIIVFEAAPKTNGICPNDAIHQGPTLQTDLCVVFLSKIHQISSSLGV